MRTNLVKNLRSGEQKITVNGKNLSLNELFKYLKDHPKDFKPFKEGGDGKVYKFGDIETKDAFIIKVLFNSSSAEVWFSEWVSKEIVEKKILSAFPLFIDKYDNTMYALEFVEYASLYPTYLEKPNVPEKTCGFFYCRPFMPFI